MSTKTPDETSKKQVAQRVVTPKRQYFVPGKGLVDEAEPQLATKKKTKRKEGDV